MKKYILVDGSGYIFRDFYALPRMSRRDGLPVNAVYGFCNMLLKLLSSLTDSDIPIVVFDAARRNWRNEIYPEYKSNRLETPPELAPQFAYIRKAAEAFGLPAVELVGFEADDIIATYATLASARGDKVCVYSSDKDLMQLLSPGVAIFDPLKNRDVDLNAVAEKFGVAPNLVPDVQALVGDTSDNIPGVSGIGPKTAAELIAKYGGLEELLAHAHNIKQDKRRETIISGAEMARISKRLATLDRDVKGLPPLDSFAPTRPDTERLASFFKDMEFNSMLAKIGAPSGPRVRQGRSADALSKDYELVDSMEKLAVWIDRCRAAGRFSVDTETTGLDALSDTLVGVSLASAAGEACYIPLAHTLLSLDMHQLGAAAALAALKPLLEDPGVKKIGHNIKYDMHIFAQSGIRLAPVEDTMVMSYVLDGAKHPHNLDYLSELYFGHTTIKFDEVVGKDKQFANVPFDLALSYAAEDADITLRLYESLSARLDAEDKAGVYEKIDRPLVGVLFDMEEAGIAVDTAGLSRLSERFAAELAPLEGEIYNIAGGRFNILSPLQLAEVLFDRLGLPDLSHRSTDSGVLRELDSPIAALILEYRALAKLKGTYSDALPRSILPRDGRVHTNYFQAGTSTGRLSSNDPNLQNIPIRSPLGQEIRAMFVAPPGRRLLSADYSQIELRILAHAAGVKGLIEAFKAGEDIHAKTAAMMFGDYSPEMRAKAKAINFGIIYGISAFGLAKNIGISRSEAQAFIDGYFHAFPEIHEYMERTKTFAREHGFVETLFGRRCFIKDINTPKLRSYAERAAINAPIQGTSADIIKIAMLRIHPRLPSGARMLLQVHDELVFEVEEGALDAAKKVIKSEMESVVRWEVPLTVDIGEGDNWKSAH